MDRIINIGDEVRFLNDVGGGKVTGFQKGGIVLVEDKDGFEVPVRESEVVLVSASEQKLTRQAKPKVQEEEYEKPEYRVKTILAQRKEKALNSIKESLERNKESARYSNSAIKEEEQKEEKPENDYAQRIEYLESRVLRLEMTVHQLQIRLERFEDAKSLQEKLKAEDKKRKELKKRDKNDIIEVDLHAEALLETTTGLESIDIKEYQLDIFRRTMREHLNEKGRKIVFIHGNGEGVLRRAIIYELRRSFKTCEYQDASFQQYGFGATMVIIH